MFTFFHRRKKIVVDCFTTNVQAYEYAPIASGISSYPDWWKKLPFANPNDLDFDDIKFRNMKNCYGFTELYKRSFVLPCWHDFRIIVTPNDGYRWNSPEETASAIEHPSSQYEGSFRDYYHIKLESPWLFKTNSKVHFLFSGATWHHEDYHFKIPTAAIEYKVQGGTNINMFLPKRQENYVTFIPLGKPLVYITPMSESRVEIKTHLISKDEMNKKSVGHSFLGHKSLVSRKTTSESKRCPFGFK